MGHGGSFVGRDTERVHLQHPWTLGVQLHNCWSVYNYFHLDGQGNVQLTRWIRVMPHREFYPHVWVWQPGYWDRNGVDWWPVGYVPPEE